MPDAVEARLMALARALDVAAHPVALDEVLGRLARALAVDAAAVRIVNGEELVLRASRGVEADAAPMRIRIGDGTSGVAAARRSPLLVSDAEASSISEPWLQIGMRSVVALPLLDGPRLVGVIKLGSREPRDFTPDVPVLELVAAWLAVTVERCREREERHLQETRERLLADFSDAVNATIDDLERTLQLTAERVAEQIGDVCAIWLLSDDGEWLTNAAMHASDPAVREAGAKVTCHRRHVDSERIATSVVREGKTLFMPQVVQESTKGFLAEEHDAIGASLGVTSVVSSPLRARGRVIGTVNIARVGPDSPAYTHGDRAFLEELAIRAGIAIDNARLNSEARQAAEALALSEQRVRALMESTSVGIVARSPDGHLVECNPAYAAMLGYTPDELLGTHVSMILPKGAEQGFERRSDSAGTEEHEQVYKCRDGSELHARITSSPVRAPDGALLYWLGLVEDVTERQRLGEQLRQAQKLEAIGALAGGVAHDFNNLLTVIRGYGQMAQQRVGEEPGGHELREILHAAERAGQLVRQLLAFSHRQRLNPELLDLNDVAHELMPMLRRLILEDVEITFTAHEPIPAVLADRGQLEQVILNLAVNARDAMPTGGTLALDTGTTEIESDQTQEMEPGRYASLSVADTGTGMSAETVDRLFEPFFTTKPAGHAAGMGLATVYGIVTQFGGHVRVETAPGEGSKFTVYLPAAPLDRTAERRVESGEAINGHGTETVLVCEDEEAVRRMTERILSGHGYTVLATERPSEALALAASHPDPIDVIVSDVIMPEMPGPELVERVRAHRPDISVILMSGYTADAIGTRTELPTGMAFLQKPFDAKALPHAIRRLLDETT